MIDAKAPNTNDRVETVAAAILTCDRPVEIDALLIGLASSHPQLDAICVVDAGTLTVNDIVNRHEAARYIRSEINLGGAGGFSLAILSALATGADWIWVLDDDASLIETNCLFALLKAARDRNLSMVSPLIVAPQDHSRTAFPFRIKGRLTHDRNEIEKTDFLPSFAHLFNGALVRREVFFAVGLPAMPLFIRGDEVDFLIKLRDASVRFGTLTRVPLGHPPGWGEEYRLANERLGILIPETAFKRYFFFRNRGYLARRHRRIRSLLGDIILYPYVFLIIRRDVVAFREWASAFYDGLMYRFDRNARPNSGSGKCPLG